MTQEPLAFTGPFTAHASADGCHAEVRRDAKVVHKFSGETAWSDAVREAEDRNVATRP